VTDVTFIGSLARVGTHMFLQVRSTWDPLAALYARQTGDPLLKGVRRFVGEVSDPVVKYLRGEKRISVSKILDRDILPYVKYRVDVCVRVMVNCLVFKVY